MSESLSLRLTRRSALVGGLAAVGLAAAGVTDASAGTPGPRPAVLDVTTATPTPWATLNTYRDVPSQCFGVDPQTGEIYTVQDDGASSIVCRLSPAGALLDWQTLRGAGQLIQAGVERDGTGVYIWGYWATPVSGAGFPFRWLFSGQGYAPVIVSTDPTVQQVPNLDGGCWQEFAIDQTTDLVTMRITQHPNETMTTYVLRSFSELKAGTGSRLGALSIPNIRSTWGPVQGQASLNGYLYAAYGGGEVGFSGDPVLVRMGWQDGSVAAVNLRGLNSKHGAKYSYAEVEGVATINGHVMVGMLSRPDGWAGLPDGWVNTVWSF